MVQRVQLTARVSNNQCGQRLDQALVKLFPDYSRSRIKKWILNQCVLVNGKMHDKPKKQVFGGESIVIDAIMIEEDIRFKPQDISLNIIYEDDNIIVINKPSDLIVHPGAGNPNGTMLNALLHHYPPLTDVPRAGIVHRLDKDTTGLMVVAKTVQVQRCLCKSLQLHQITREYEAVAIGHITAAVGTIEQPIRRHQTKRTRMSIHPMGKPAVTHYRMIEYFRVHTRLRLSLETGRTHQIRVHMAYIHHPLVGDQVYGGRPYLPKGASTEFIAVLRKFDRQALHAIMLRLYHPISRIEMEWHAPRPQDMVDLIDAMRADFEINKDAVEWL